MRRKDPGEESNLIKLLSLIDTAVLGDPRLVDCIALRVMDDYQHTGSSEAGGEGGVWVGYMSESQGGRLVAS